MNNVPKERLIERFSRFMYRKFYNRYKYRAFIQLRLVRWVVHPLYSFFNFFYFMHLKRFYLRHIDRLSKKGDLFFMGRRDFGTHLYGLHYLRLWKQTRGEIHLLVFTKESAHIKRLAQCLLPDMEVIYPDSFFDHLVLILFGHQLVFFHTLLPLYANLCTERPDLLHMFDLAESPYTRYHHYLDPYLDLDNNFKNWNLDQVKALSLTGFIEAYKQIRRQFDYRPEVFSDMCRLHYQTRSSPVVCSHFQELKRNLNINKPYILINVNTKTYIFPSSRRTIQYPSRYNCLIDTLIEKGYQVILQGGNEQPDFSPRNGFFNYAKSPFRSIENDLALYSKAECIIASKSGVEQFALLCNTPVLGLNYTEILGMQPSKKMRFFPKFVQLKKENRFLSWKEYLASPQFYEIGIHSFGEKVEYVDLEEEEMLLALEEFLPLLSKGETEWLSYTPLQQEFKSRLTPLHLELYLSKAVPCNRYLEKSYVS